jgi:hypothetical protein
MTRWARCGGVLACLMGCAGSSEESPLPTHLEEIQGAAPDAEHAFTVGIRQTSFGGAVCSGVLVAPNLVVTARHCVSVPGPPIIECLSSTFGDLVPLAGLHVTAAPEMTAEAAFVGVSKIVVPASPHNKFCGDDIALLVLEASIPMARYATPALESFGAVGEMDAHIVTAIGYGLDSPADESGISIGVRRIKENLAVTCAGGDEQIASCSTAANRVSAGELLVADAGACVGDSGSGIYDQAEFDAGNWVALGTLSRGSVSADGRTCVDSVYVRFDFWPELFHLAAAHAASIGGYRLPDWATNGCASGTICSEEQSPRESHGGCSLRPRPDVSEWRIALVGLVLAARVVRFRRGQPGRGRSFQP